MEAERWSAARWSHWTQQLGAQLLKLSDALLLALNQAHAAGAAFIGNDSGPTHLAAAIGLPTTALFGPTDPDLWHPIGDRVQVLAPGGDASWPTLTDALAALSLQ